MKFIAPLITVANIQQSRKFYEEILQQKVKYDFGENVTFEGDFSIHLQSHFASLINEQPINQGGNNFELYFEYDDVDEIIQHLKAHRVEFIHEAQEQPWRQKVARFYDPDHHIIEVGESMEFLAYRLSKEQMPISKISEIISMSIEFVKISISKYQ